MFPEGGAAGGFCPAAGEEGASSLSASPAFPQNAERRGQPGPRQPLHVHAPLDGVLAQARALRPPQKIARVLLPGPSASGQPPTRQICGRPQLIYIFLSSPRGLFETCQPVPGAVQEILWPFVWMEQTKRSFWVLASFRLSYRPLRACFLLMPCGRPKSLAAPSAPIYEMTSSAVCYGRPLTHRKPKSLLAPYGK
jgi:hypothetical protein